MCGFVLQTAWRSFIRYSIFQEALGRNVICGVYFITGNDKLLAIHVDYLLSVLKKRTIAGK